MQQGNPSLQYRSSLSRNYSITIVVHSLASLFIHLSPARIDCRVRLTFVRLFHSDSLTHHPGITDRHTIHSSTLSHSPLLQKTPHHLTLTHPQTLSHAPLILLTIPLLLLYNSALAVATISTPNTSLVSIWIVTFDSRPHYRHTQQWYSNHLGHPLQDF